MVRELRAAGKSEWTIAGVLKAANRVFKFANRRLGWYGINPVGQLEDGERPKLSAGAQATHLHARGARADARRRARAVAHPVRVCRRHWGAAERVPRTRLGRPRPGRRRGRGGQLRVPGRPPGPPAAAEDGRIAADNRAPPPARSHARAAQARLAPFHTRRLRIRQPLGTGARAAQRAPRSAARAGARCRRARPPDLPGAPRARRARPAPPAGAGHAAHLPLLPAHRRQPRDRGRRVRRGGVVAARPPQQRRHPGGLCPRAQDSRADRATSAADGRPSPRCSCPRPRWARSRPVRHECSATPLHPMADVG